MAKVEQHEQAVITDPDVDIFDRNDISHIGRIYNFFTHYHYDLQSLDLMVYMTASRMKKLWAML